MMKSSPPRLCVRCGGSLRGAFVGQVCPRCLMASAASTSVGPDFSDVREAALSVPALTEPEAWQVGMRLGDYELLDVLGKGGMAVVYLARQISLDRLVALKTIAASLAADAASQERFRREARAVAQLDHPGIVSVHDTGMLCGALYYTMDHVDGSDLGRVLRERTLLPRQVASLMRRVADAVGYAHGRGIVHRDLKPANILLDTAGEPHVADFGLAFEIGGMGGPTLTGDLLGTPPYMAPEVLATGAKRATPPSDVYSLGAMLFQMLTGRTPFIAGSPSEILHLALDAQPPSPRLLNPAVPRDLETICLKCLEKDPSSRYRDAGLLAEDLGRFLAGEPILARPASAPMRVWRWSRRRPALATFIVALAIGAVGATWAAFAIEAGRQRALAAEAGAREGLWRANLAHAQAARRTTQPDARREALAALADAARFRPSLALRNEAIAALCLGGAEVRRSWAPGVAWGATFMFDPVLETYVAETSPGLLLRRACADDREVGRFEFPQSKTLGLPIFSPDRAYLAVRYADDVVRVWDTATARIVFTVPDRPSPIPVGAAALVRDMAFRPDGTQLAIGLPGGGFTLHAVPGGAEQGRWTADDVRPTIMHFSPDGSLLALVGRNRPDVRFLDAQALKELRRVPLPAVPVCATWNLSGDGLAVGTRASRIHFIRAATGEVIDTAKVYESGGVGQIVYHPRLPMIAGNGGDEAVSFWDAVSGRLLMKLDGVSDSPVLTYNPDGTRLGGFDNYTFRATIADIQASPIFASAAPTEPTHAALCSGALGMSADNRWLVCSKVGSVDLRDAHTGRLLNTYTAAEFTDMLSAQLSPDNRALWVCSKAHGLRRIEIVTAVDGAPKFGPAQVIDPEANFDIEDIAENGRVLLCSEEAQAAKVVDPARSGSPIICWSTPKITSAAFAPDGRQVLTENGEPVPGEMSIKVWDISGATPVCAASFDGDSGGRVQCSRRGGWVLVTGDHETALWHFGTWKRGPALPKELQVQTHHAHLSPDGSTLAVEADGKLHLVDTATGKVMATCEAAVTPAGICVNEIFSADGARLAMQWQYGSVHLWDLAAMHRELAKLGLDWSAAK